MNQSAMSRAIIQCILISITYSYVYFTKLTKDSKNSNCATLDAKNDQKNHPLHVAKKYVETYSSSNAAARDPKEKAFYN